MLHSTDGTPSVKTEPFEWVGFVLAQSTREYIDLALGSMTSVPRCAKNATQHLTPLFPQQA